MALATSALQIASTPPPGEEIFGPRGPFAVPYPWFEQLLQWSVVVLVAFLVWRSGLWLLTAPAKTGRKAVPIDYRKSALAALERLRRSPMWTEDQVKDVCEHLARILKDFLKNQFNIGWGAAATSDECLDFLEQHRVVPALQDQVAVLLRLFDEVKFARGSLGATTHEDLYQRIRDLLLQEEWLS